MGLFKKIFKKVAPIALPILGSLVAPGVGTALGVTAGSTLAAPGVLSGIGGAIGGGVGGSLNGGGLSGVLKGAAIGGAGGYLAGGGLSDLLTSTGLSSVGSGLTGDFASGLSGTAADTPFTTAAREAISSTATSAAPSTNFLTGFLPDGGTAAAGGGTSGGFFSLGDAAKSFGGGVTGDFASGLATEAPSGLSRFLASPIGYVKDAAISGVDDVLKPSNLAKGALKGGLSYYLSKDNASGYGGVQNAANEAAENFQPYLQSGTAAQTELADLSGLNGPEAQAAAMAAYEADPGFTFARDEGIKGLDASAVKRGMLLSGNQIQDIQKYGTGLSRQFFQDYINRLAGIAGQGQRAAQNVSQNQIDAATIAALAKANKKNRFNELVGGLTAYL